MHAKEMQRCLEEGDVEGVRRLWAHVAPHLPQPHDDVHAERTMHIARTASNLVSFKCRAYSHRWLVERGLPSGLPDYLKPRADRLYPRVVSATGLAVASRYPEVKREMMAAMTEAVLEAYDDMGGSPDPAYVKARIMEAKAKALRRLFGGLE